MQEMKIYQMVGALFCWAVLFFPFFLFCFFSQYLLWVSYIYIAGLGLSVVDVHMDFPSDAFAFLFDVSVRELLVATLVILVHFNLNMRR